MSLNFHAESGSSLWIQNLVNGRSGLCIRAKHALFCDSSPFQKIEVFDTYTFGTVLCLGGTIVNTEKDSFAYNEMIVHPAMLMHKKPERVCIIGGGDGGCLREVLKYSDVKSVVVVEIDEMVKTTVEKFFPVLAKGFKDSRTEIVYDDGYHFLKTDKSTFDVIIVDSFDPGGPVASLETADFHRVVSTRLSEDGIAVFQTDSPTIKRDTLRRAIQSVSPFFKYKKTYLCSLRSFPEGICSFLICSNKEEILGNFDKERYKPIVKHCNYYNEDLHVGAFLLPQHIKKLLKG
ncbi:MAG: polyamine aminopropyltransferase [Fibrobacter sp.]|nr:polyamine aminopropyltransferase [Fibrobacter sp.]